MDNATILVHDTIEIMKKIIIQKSQSVRLSHIWLILLFVSSASLWQLLGETTFTNQDGLGFGLVVSKTNLTVGDKVLASMIVSNGLDVERTVGWATGNPCSTKFGEFLIIEKDSGKRIDCTLPLRHRIDFVSESLGVFEGHESQEFGFNLVDGYGLTNAGIYTVQAMGKFQYHESPEKRFTLLTPPIVVYLAPKAETNSTARRR